MKHLTILLVVVFLHSCSDINMIKNKTEAQNILTDLSTRNFTDPLDNIKEYHTNNAPDKIEAPFIIQGFCKSVPPPPSGNTIVVKGKKPAFDPNKPFSIIENGVAYEGKVCINYKEFSGRSPYNIPFIATAIGSIAEIYVDNKKVNEYKGVSGEIYFRRNISLEFGYNRIPVKVVGMSGKTSESYIEITIESTPDKIEIKTTE